MWKTLNREVVERFHITKASVIMVDCDLYSSTKEALNFCAPLIRDQVVIFFDDWNAAGLAEKNMGERRAFDIWLKDNRELTAEELHGFNYKNKADVKVFLVSRVG